MNVLHQAQIVLNIKHKTLTIHALNDFKIKNMKEFCVPSSDISVLPPLITVITLISEGNQTHNLAMLHIITGKNLSPSPVPGAVVEVLEWLCPGTSWFYTP